MSTHRHARAGVWPATARFVLDFIDAPGLERRWLNGGLCVKVYPLTDDDCCQLLAEAGFGRLACCRDNQPYVVPIYFVLGDRCIYSFALPGKKVRWMRENPQVCIETDSVTEADDWSSVVVFGRYTELEESAEFQRERARAHLLLQGRPMWWQPGAFSVEGGDDSRGHVPIFYRVAIERMTGYRAQRGSKHDGAH